MAAAGPTTDSARQVAVFDHSRRIPKDAGLTGTAFRPARPCIINDFLTERSNQRIACTALARRRRTRSGAAFPLLSSGAVAGVLLFLAGEEDIFTPDFVELLQRLAENISFALENFDRADEKTQGGRADRISRLA